MKISVYIPQTLIIKDSDLPALTEKARKRHGLAPGKTVRLHHIVEEARREGLIDLGADYCLDLDFAEEVPASRRNRKKGREAATKSVERRRSSSHHEQLKI